MITNSRDYVQIIKNEFDKRSNINGNYSLRAFARDLELAPSRLSEVLKRKQGLSADYAQKIGKRLNFTPYEIDYFSTLVEMKHGRSKVKRENAQRKYLGFLKDSNETFVKLESLEIIGNWYHMALCELTKLKGFKNEPKKISKQLGISATDILEATERLYRLGFLKLKNGKLGVDKFDLKVTPSEIPSQTIKNLHLQILDKAKDALLRQDISKRNFTSSIMAIDEEKIPDAKKLINEFNSKMNELVTNSTHRDNVYCFSTQLFSLIEKERSND